MTCILKDKTSYLNLFYVLESFGKCSGLKVNDEKTEILALGNNSLQESDFAKHNFCKVIKILGIYFGYDVFTNEKLSRIGLVESPSCTFCQEAAESVEHLFFSCKISSDFWKHVLSWLRDNNVLVGTMDESDLIFGKFNIVNDFILINHILLLGKYYIYSRRCLNSVPTLRGFIARTRCVYNIELHIAREKNKLLAHFKKWKKLINAII